MTEETESKYCVKVAGMSVENKIVSASGRIFLGKQYAGRTFTFDQVAEGVWTLQLIPDDELWLHGPEMRKNLDRALEWSATHPRTETLEK